MFNALRFGGLNACLSTCGYAEENKNKDLKKIETYGHVLPSYSSAGRFDLKYLGFFSSILTIAQRSALSASVLSLASSVLPMQSVVEQALTGEENELGRGVGGSHVSFPVKKKKTSLQ